MEQNSFIEQLQKLNPELSQHISPITDNDNELITSFFQKPSTDSKDSIKINFEDSFEYIRLYFNSGRYQGFKFYDNESLLIFAIESKKKPHFKLFKPIGTRALKKLLELIKILSNFTNYSIQMVCMNNNELKEIKKIKQLDLKNIKEFNYYIYDLEMPNDLRGNHWKNVRQKIKSFNKNHPKLKTQKLSPENCTKALHFIGNWRRELLDKRGHSYTNLEKNKFAVQYYADKNDFKNIWGTIYKLHGRVVAVQLLYRLGENSAAHAIGIADTEFSGLAEATQIDCWKQVYDCGIRFVNDGASWRAGLNLYKRKFNPIGAQKVYECKIKAE
jgi:hypothetical protein